MTGLGQMRGRNLIDFEQGVKLDREYIDRGALWLGGKILLKAVPAALFRRGAM